MQPLRESLDVPGQLERAVRHILEACADLGRQEGQAAQGVEVHGQDRDALADVVVKRPGEPQPLGFLGFY